MKSTTIARTVLIADDDPFVRSLLEHCIEMSGHTAISTDNGRDALNLCLTRQPDFAILDYQMPQLTGLEVGAAIHGVVPFMIFSGNDMQSEASAIGAKAFLRKPAKAATIIDTLNDLLKDIE